jgi:hypothetical protein
MTMWLHSAVPIGGMVKSVTEGMVGEMEELVAFGEIGGTAEWTMP